MNRIQLKELSKSQLKGSWKMPIILTIIYFGVSMMLSFIQGSLESSLGIMIMLLLTLGFGIWATVGIPNFYLEFIKKGGEVKLSDALVPSNKLLKSFIYSLLIFIITFVISFVVLFILSFGLMSIFITSESMSLSLIIGGIISVGLSLIFIVITIALAQVPYIILETDLGTIDCMKSSIKMMKGHKWEYFVLYLSFIGWGILATLTFGIGYIWLIPYTTLTFTNYYKDISKNII